MRHRYLVVGLLLASAAPLYAQADLTELLRAGLQADAQKLVAAGMRLQNADAETFWPIYRAYEGERVQWSDRRMALIKDYAVQYDTMTDDQAGGLAKQWFKLQEDRLQLWKSYYGKVAKAVSPSVAARFVQVESQLNQVFDLEIAKEMPLIFKAPR
jgi:hypothetical protein